MAEVLLKVHTDNPNSYNDGDIVCAFNDNSIKRVFSELITNPHRWDKNGDGYLDEGSLPYKMFKKRNQYRFERRGIETVVRILNEDESEEDVSSQMAVREFIAKRRVAWLGPGQRGLPLFGTPGYEIWFGGNTKTEEAVINSVWDDIENDTPNHRDNHIYWPLTPNELGNFLGLATDNFTDEESGELTSPEIDDSDPENPVTVFKRKKKVEWRDVPEISGDSVDCIETRGLVYEVRNEGVHNRSEIIVTKS